MPVRAAVSKGFTLIELVIGITVFGIVMTLVTTLMGPQTLRSVDPVLQVRAAEFAQSLLSEILSKSFDEQSDRISGEYRCGEDIDGDSVIESCTAPGDLGPEEASREQYDDVDDYHNLSQSGSGITDSAGQPLTDGDGNPLYAGYTAQVTVFYDGSFDGVPVNAITHFKRVNVVITTPTGQRFAFSGYRGNY